MYGSFGESTKVPLIAHHVTYSVTKYNSFRKVLYVSGIANKFVYLVEQKHFGKAIFGKYLGEILKQCLLIS